MSTELNDRQAQLRKSVDKLLSRIREANRPFVSDRLRERIVRGCGVSSNAQWLSVIVQVDEALAGAPYKTVSPGELAEVVASWRRRKEDTTLALHTMYVRGFWSILLGIRHPKDLPADFARALEVPEPVRKVHGRVLKDEELVRVLEAVRKRDVGTRRAFRTTMKIAALWTLRDVGHRAREMLSLNIGDVSFKSTKAQDGQTVLSVALRLRKDAPNLKTGPRPVAGTKCAGPLKAWLDLHPRSKDPRAPLFCGINDDTGLHRWDYQQLRKTIARAAREAGISETPEHPAPLKPHDFRHTAATEKARTPGWNELMMKEHFGWSGGSDMPSHYAHLCFEDLENQVLRDAGIEAKGSAVAKPLATSSTMDDGAVLAALRRLVMSNLP